MGHAGQGKRLPLHETPTDFRNWIRDRGRAALFGHREQHALRRCQSFWVRELSMSDLTDADLVVEFTETLSFGRG